MINPSNPMCQPCCHASFLVAAGTGVQTPCPCSPDPLSMCLRGGTGVRSPRRPLLCLPWSTTSASTHAGSAPIPSEIRSGRTRPLRFRNPGAAGAQEGQACTGADHRPWPPPTHCFRHLPAMLATAQLLRPGPASVCAYARPLPTSAHHHGPEQRTMQ